MAKGMTTVMSTIFKTLGVLLLAPALLKITNGSLFALTGLRLTDEVRPAVVGFITSGHFVGLLMGLVFGAPVWFELRILIGYCMAGLFMALESWINDGASNEKRGQTFA